MSAPVPLNTVAYDGPGDVPLVIAHGLFGSARNWNVIAKRLSTDRPVVAVDMRNHGDSPHDPDNSYAALAADLRAVIEGLGGTADLLGHSMGGKAAMMVGLQAPEVLRHLVIADIAPVAYTHTQMPLIKAMQKVDLGAVSRRSDADAQLKAAVPDAMLRAFLLQSLSVGPDGARWKLNLDALGAQMGRIIGFPQDAGTSALPATFLRGGASDYATGPQEAAIMAAFPAARIEEMPGLGHWLHAEDPRGFETRLRTILGEGEA
ncbi:alpha/beta fold hydrolase [Oceanibium sediminis]|uniref:alpha/beta fold hydrolase n=1 Tax=Oceanibium sediminis TaxID=2026339 RepID=UPI001E2DFBCE|nr:alpha/beta fold hydrolase [Oceanibium sediminis]